MATVAAGCTAWRQWAGPIAGPRRPMAFVDDASLTSLRAAVGYGPANPGGPRLVALVSATRGDWARRDRDMRRAFRTRRVGGELLLTGYYVPEIAASLERTDEYRHPIYARPPDLVRGEPHRSRAEIAAGALDGAGLELAWARDPVDLFLLHVQGSGRIRLPSGETRGLLFAATNGRPYTSLGSVMIAKGLVTRERSTIPDLRRALGALPVTEQFELMNRNQRYAFFRLDDGPVVGSAAVPLTPGRSVAVDPALIPPGSLLYLETATYRRFVVAQDAGAAIKGARADLFLGEGHDAGNVAGRLRDRGRLWILEPR